MLPKELDALAAVALDRPSWFGFEATSDLPDVTEAAIRALARNPGGFFLMVEGGQIDWRSHNNETAETLAEMYWFDDAICHAVRFKEVHPEETLIVVVGDHETGGLTFDEALTAKWTSGDHTGADVPLFADGVGAERFAEEAENTAVYHRIIGLIGAVAD